jgi:hypothetical protein
MNKVNKTFRSMYPFYNSATGKMVAGALRELVLSVWNAEADNPLNKFAVVGEADFLLPALPRGSILCDECKDRYLPLPQGNFSHVAAFDFFKDKTDEKHFIKELYRITEDGGKVIFIAAKKNSFWTYDESMPFKGSVQYNDNELKSLFTEIGFSNLSFGKALLLPPALYNENFAAKEQKFKNVLGWLAGITAVFAQKESLAVIPAAENTFSFGKNSKTIKQQTTVTVRDKNG